MAILFLEPDDEITSAVARLRQVSDSVAALVLPAGSRIASSRINFRLLAREAAEHRTRLAIVTPDTAARALAVAAGIPAYGAVREYEAAAVDGGSAAVLASSEVDADTTVVSAVARDAPAAAGAPPVVATEGPLARVGKAMDRLGGRGLALRSRRAGTLVLAALAVALIGGAGAAGVYFLLPEAHVAITPRVESFAPLTFEVTADPDATSDDPAAGIFAAEWLESSFDASDTFRATGVKVTETKATGSVVFTNSDTGNDGAVSIPAGSIVQTKKGVAFKTLRDIVVPRADLGPFVPGKASVDIEAVEPGLKGNVEANTVTVIPPGYSKRTLRVTNPEPTSGGSHSEAKVVRKSDYDAAVGKLNEALQDSFDAWVDDEVERLGETVVQRESATLEAAFEPASGEIVGSATESFDLGAQAAGRVVAFDPAALDAIGAQRFQEHGLPAGYALLDGSIAVEHVQLPSDDPARPRYEVTAHGQGYRQLDPNELKSQILGRPLGEAQAILGRDGTVTISLQPDWFGTIPALDWRVSVEVVTPAGSS